MQITGHGRVVLAEVAFIQGQGAHTGLTGMLVIAALRQMPPDFKP